MSHAADWPHGSGCWTTVQSAQSIRVEPTRLSLLDPFLPGEPGLDPCVCVPNVAVLYVMNHPVAIIHATPIDQASLESCLSRVRTRPPRTAVLRGPSSGRR
jgi:hypothetical protein